MKRKKSSLVEQLKNEVDNNTYCCMTDEQISQEKEGLYYDED